MSNEKKSNNNTTFSQRLLMFAAAVVGILVTVGGISYGLWWVVAKHVPSSILAIWALLATALIPVSIWGGVRYGQTESRGVVNGLAAGVGAVMKAANDTANLKVTMGRQARGVPEQPPVMPRLLDVTPQVVHDEWQ